MMHFDVLLELLDILLEQAEARELGHNYRSFLIGASHESRGARCRKESEPDPLYLSSLYRAFLSL